ncbi:glycoside hydrolase family 2 protein [Amniculicola lignicola CBS 123094]|uniref:Glycoside hydrolase family 2 protein n=1 Tax=Amniculicola lignicola CBS 123094 TaxID=1392246 RepID=A0A6A5VVS0_9PLEO|nr:glycoside hydrolase family 2 protein [Amniculicola lignicola CBS 123094]
MLLLLLFTSLVTPQTLDQVPLSNIGKTATVPVWKVQSTSKTGQDVSKISSLDFDTKGWYNIGSRGTLMSTLLDNNVFTESGLFFSANLQKVDAAQFQVPWFYRAEMTLTPGNGSYFQLLTHGITSRADVHVNGKQIASKDVQAGAYAGQAYDITSAAKQGGNVIVVRVHPTDYNRDFALGFVDWNPYPPDNGTGIWRDIEVKWTREVSLSVPRVTTRLDGSISIHLDVTNLGDRGIQGEVVCSITSPAPFTNVGKMRAEFRINAKLQQSLKLSFKIPEPQIWWPAQWGEQPLYQVSCDAFTGAGLSDTTPRTLFGIRTVTSRLNKYNDTIFYVNGEPFHVLGAGYTSDIFLRFDVEKVKAQLQLVLDMGLNTVRLEGKQEHPLFYAIADEMGIMLLAGWECCDKWEGWSYNDEGSGLKWTSADYSTANQSMRHEAEMMQQHPNILGFLIGSDFWPDDKATSIYVSALRAYNWDTPILSSASQRGYPAQLGNGGMKMEGPYDWVPPSYWGSDKLGGAWGFGSELSAGVGTPVLSSLQKFLSPADLEDLWKKPNKGLYHMSTSASQFYDRGIYNAALWARYGPPTSLADYLLKSQMMDYEATRSQFEAYVLRWNAERPATGMVYWMLNNAWPSLHWNLFDYYLRTGGSYFGAKSGLRSESTVYDYVSGAIYLINRSRVSSGPRTVDVEIMGLEGKVGVKNTIETTTQPNKSKTITPIPGLGRPKETSLLRLVLKEGDKVLSRSVYWISPKQDTLDWDKSTWYYTPTSSYADFTALNAMKKADVNITAKKVGAGKVTVSLENKSSIPAVFVGLDIVDGSVGAVFWSENYVSLWPGEKMEVDVKLQFPVEVEGLKVRVSGRNVDEKVVVVGRTF